MGFTFGAKGNGGLFYVPDTVVDRYLGEASHMQLKALLYLLRRCDAFTAEEACFALHATLSELEGAVNYWCTVGVLEIEAGEVRLRLDTIGQDSTRTAQSDAITSVPTYTFEEITKALDGDPKLKSLFQSVQRILNKPLSNAQTKALFSLHDFYGFPPETVFTLAKFNANWGKNDFKELLHTAQDWYRMGIISEEAALAYIEQQNLRRSDEYMLRKLFGVGERSLSSSEKKLFQTWREEYRFSEEMLRLAYDRCVDAKQRYLPKYIDSILRSWFEKGYKTPQEAANEPAPEKALHGAGRKKKAESEATFDAQDFLDWSFKQIYGDKEEGKD